MHSGWYDRKVRRVRDLSCADTRIDLDIEVRRVQCRSGGKVHRERRDFLANTPLYTKRFAWFVGRRCRQSTSKAVARELNRDWHPVKELDKHYLRIQLERAGLPGPKVVGRDAISIRKGHTSRIVVSDLVRGRPLWFGGQDRSEASMDQFSDWLSQKTAHGIRLAVRDLGKPFGNATRKQAPQAAILFDTFPVLRHLGAALDVVRKRDYARLAGQDRRYIRGQNDTVLARRETLTLDGRQAVKKLLAANKRRNTASLLKESFGHLGSSKREAGARKFFENWKASLKWPRLTPYEKVAAMIARHWDGMAAVWKVENTVSLGVVEGVNNTSRLIQRRAYGRKDEEYLRLNVLTCILPAI